MKRLRHILPLLFALTFATLASHGPALTVPLQGDDFELFNTLERRTPADLLGRFAPSVWRHSQTGGYAPYRPARDFVYIACALLFGARPFPFHALSLLFHCSNALLVYWLAVEIYRSRRVAFWGALLFAASAAHVEAVTYTKNLAETQALFFGLLSLCLAIRSVQGERVRLGTGAGAAIAYALAVLTKESAWPMPILFGIWLALRPRRAEGERPGWTSGLLAALLLLAVGYGALLVSMQRAGEPTRFPADMSALSLPARIEFASRTTLGYLANIFLPVRQSYWPQPPLPRGAGPYTLAAAGVAAGLILMSIRGRTTAQVAFGVWWMCLALGPVSNLIAGDTGRPIAWQRVYTPSVGWALFIGCLAAGWPMGTGESRQRRRRAQGWLAATAGLLIAANIAGAMHHTIRWQTPLSLWRHTVRHAPDSFQPHFNLGLTYREAGHLPQAAAHYRAAVRIRPDSADGLYNLANALHHLARFEEAENFFRRTVRLDPERHQAYNGLGAALASQGRMDEAEAAFDRAFEIAPHSLLAAQSLIRIYESAGRHEDIARVASKALKRHPTHTGLQENLSRAMERLRRDTE